MKYYLFSLLLILIIIWVVKAMQNKKNLIALFGKRDAIRMPLVIIEIVLVLQLTFPHILQMAEANQLLIQIGLLLATLGTAIAIWARLVMDANWGVPAQHNKIEQITLITHGPFRFSRNPIYLGLILLIVGFELALSSWLIFLTPLLVWYFNEIIKKEESLLTKLFGKQFSKYIDNVRRYI